jgi:hypothetical protein
MPRISGAAVADYARSVGFNNQGNPDLTIAVAVAKAESGWNTDARYVTPQEDSRGLWQINTYAHPDLLKYNLYDPWYNAFAAWQVFRNAGFRWTPWTTYTRGTYLQFWDEAVAAVNGSGSVAPPLHYGPPVAPPAEVAPGGGGFPVDSGSWDYNGDIRWAGDLFRSGVSDSQKFTALMRGITI